VAAQGDRRGGRGAQAAAGAAHAPGPRHPAVQGGGRRGQPDAARECSARSPRRAQHRALVSARRRSTRAGCAPRTTTWATPSSPATTSSACSSRTGACAAWRALAHSPRRSFRRILLVSKSEIFGSFDVDWEFGWEQLARPPFVNQKGLNVPFKVRLCSLPLALRLLVWWGFRSRTGRRWASWARRRARSSSSRTWTWRGWVALLCFLTFCESTFDRLTGNGRQMRDGFQHAELAPSASFPARCFYKRFGEDFIASLINFIARNLYVQVSLVCFRFTRFESQRVGFDRIFHWYIACYCNRAAVCSLYRNLKELSENIITCFCACARLFDLLISIKSIYVFLRITLTRLRLIQFIVFMSSEVFPYATRKSILSEMWVFAVCVLVL